MWRKSLVLLALITALVIPVGVFVTPAKAVSQPSCWGDPSAHDGNNFVGWQKPTSPTTGSYESANITDYGNVVEAGTTGNVRGEIRVDNGWVPSRQRARHTSRPGS